MVGWSAVRAAGGVRAFVRVWFRVCGCVFAFRGLFACVLSCVEILGQLTRAYSGPIRFSLADAGANQQTDRAKRRPQSSEAPEIDRLETAECTCTCACIELSIVFLSPSRRFPRQSADSDHRAPPRPVALPSPAYRTCDLDCCQKIDHLSRSISPSHATSSEGPLGGCLPSDQSPDNNYRLISLFRSGGRGGGQSQPTHRPSSRGRLP